MVVVGGSFSSCSKSVVLCVTKTMNDVVKEKSYEVIDGRIRTTEIHCKWCWKGFSMHG